MTTELKKPGVPGDLSDVAARLSSSTELAEVSPKSLAKKGPRLGLGCWAIGGPFWSGEQPLGWGPVDDSESARAIRTGLDCGVRLFDTADVYGAGHSERLLGRTLGSDREKVLIATKWGNVFDEESKQLTGTNISGGYVREACEASLRRLGTDRIDIFQLHVGDLELDRLPTIVEELEKLRTSGKIRSFGWSTDDPQRAESILKYPGAEVVQFELNVLQVAASRKRR